MKARAKEPHRTIRAFTGRIFVAYEWRDVPDGCDAEAEGLEAAGLLELKFAPEPVVVEPLKIDATRGAVELAESFSVNLADVVGTGVGGRILKIDVEAVLDEEE